MKRFLLPWNREQVAVLFTDVLVLGSGIAGLYTAIKASQFCNVTVLTKKAIRDSNTEHAQGGIAAAIDEADSPALHFEDTLSAGAGLCDEPAVRILVEEGPARVEELINMGANFDHKEGVLALTREGAHSRRRILHAQGDATGWEIERTLVSKTLKSPGIEVKEHRFLLDILQNESGEVLGALAFNELEKRLEAYLANATVLATGGVGQVYRFTTNPDVATGDGMAAAFRAGAELMDMEFVQFHPTALVLPNAPRFLISEAVRGEGAYLINSKGKRFMADVPGMELAPRDVVARAIWQEMNNGPVYLDFRPIGEREILERFPKIHQTCHSYGINVLNDPVPVAPAAHYMMGGVRTNINGETNLPNLYACGEVACNGVHGANRLASNSLLDGLVFGAKIAEHLKGKLGKDLNWREVETAENNDRNSDVSASSVGLRSSLQTVMWDKVGIIRKLDSLLEAENSISAWAQNYSARENIEDLQLGNMLDTALAITKSALARSESRGGHYRLDYPNRNDELWKKHTLLSKEGQDVSCIPVSGSN